MIEIEPGELICKTHCPCCGARLEIMHGDDPGTTGVLGEAPVVIDKLKHAMRKACTVLAGFRIDDDRFDPDELAPDVAALRILRAAMRDASE